ncbi:MAG: helix-turn-helix domain-containing protein [Anaerolineae bacterium]|jgi:excisionase family DNA binding protein|nr:helix-turn-helix domain-containing protein [Anaerolineae bacterium]MBT3712157.1 helix-turn-helix domain-containing protein [Anaerolineae bacterium]MBT4312223.1 helix-turn-helix domain-containing protein [Anaerolineae bacterium]MBT4457540.1 helix-turn-helix domain-containing protein [Anaerolineae bacterium]MBT4843595.1 helix-turn-helix domain-containing protein [Anaerolineae bacterium]
MARIFDVIEYPNEMENEIVHRFPETGIGDYRIGSQVIVRESQNAIFFRDGQALDKFGPGRHTIATANIPKVIDFIGKAFNNRTPFPAEVYFVSMKEFTDLKWGTPQPIIVRNPGVGLGVALLQGFGTYSVEVGDPQQFVTQVVGTDGSFMLDEIDDRLRNMLLSKFADLLGETGAKSNVLEMIGLTEELGAGVRAKAQPDFAALGLTLKSFYIGNLKPSSKSAQELRDMGMLDLSVYTQLQAADAMRDAAQNEGGGAGLTAGIGAGMGIGNLMQNATSGAATQQQAAPAAAASGGMPSVMTPAEAASILKVSQEDVMAAITAGDLKAKKLGNAYRISKGALEKFLSE